MRRISIALVLPLLALFGIGGAHAADDAAVCNERAGDASIRACSNLIRSGRLQGAELAAVHINRALARLGRDQIKLAIVDLDAALRIDQRRPAARVAAGWPVQQLADQIKAKSVELSQAGKREDSAALSQRGQVIARRATGSNSARTSSDQIIQALTNNRDDVRTRRIGSREGGGEQAAPAAPAPPPVVASMPPPAAGAPAPPPQAAPPPAPPAGGLGPAPARVSPGAVAVGSPRPTMTPPPAAGQAGTGSQAAQQGAGGSGAPAAGTQQAPASAAFPEFPWPPPAASASYVFPRRFFKEGQTLGEVTDSILTALEKSGYVERSFFRTKADGIALVTRLESINEDGTPRVGPARWPSVRNRPAVAGLEEFLRGLFFVDRGRYRVIVFILQDKPFAQSSERVVADDARNWLRSGLNTLPPEIARRPYGNSDCSALIYEFASDGSSVRVVESSMTGRQHLEKAGVIPSLGPAN